MTPRFWGRAFPLHDELYKKSVDMQRTKHGGEAQEAARILGESLNYARQGQLAVRDPSFKPTVTVIDIPLPAAPPAAAPAVRN